MLKSFIYITLATVLIFSILAPSVINLCSETDPIVLLDTTEEEKSEKVEKNLEEKILTYNTLYNKSLISYKKRTTDQYYLEINTDYTIKVLLPPPEQFI